MTTEHDKAVALLEAHGIYLDPEHHSFLTDRTVFAAMLADYRQQVSDEYLQELAQGSGVMLEKAFSLVDDEIVYSSDQFREAIASLEARLEQATIKHETTFTHLMDVYAEFSAKWGDNIFLKITKEREQSEARVMELEKDAALGRCAMRFVDRAGDVAPGIDDAETICSEFSKAMHETLMQFINKEIGK